MVNTVATRKQELEGEEELDVEFGWSKITGLIPIFEMRKCVEIPQHQSPKINKPTALWSMLVDKKSRWRSTSNNIWIWFIMFEFELFVWYNGVTCLSARNEQMIRLTYNREEMQSKNRVHHCTNMNYESWMIMGCNTYLPFEYGIPSLISLNIRIILPSPKKRAKKENTDMLAQFELAIMCSKVTSTTTS